MSDLEEDDVLVVKLPCHDGDQFLFAFAHRMRSSIFVATDASRPPGARFRLHVRFQDGEVHVRGIAEVVRSAEEPRPGLLVRLLTLDSDSIQFPLKSAPSPSAPTEHTTGETFVPPTSGLHPVPVGEAASAPVAGPPPLPEAPAPAAVAGPPPLPVPEAPDPFRFVKSPTLGPVSTALLPELPPVSSAPREAPAQASARGGLRPFEPPSPLLPEDRTPAIGPPAAALAVTARSPSRWRGVAVAAVVLVLLLGGAALLASGPGSSPRPNPSAAKAGDRALDAALTRLDARLSAGQLVGPGGDTALDWMRAVLAHAPADSRVRSRQTTLAQRFEERVAEAEARHDTADVAVELTALSLVDPDRRDVATRLAAAEAEVKRPRPPSR